MRITLSSNIVSGVYEVLEVALCGLLAYCIETIIGALHVKKLYHENEPIHLSYSRMHIFSNCGVTTKKLYRLSVLVTVTIIILISVGGFAFTGVSVEVYNDVPVKYLVKRAEKGKLLDLNRHVSFEDGLFSGTLLMLNFASRCWTDIRGKVFYYVYHHKDEIPDFDDQIFGITDIWRTVVQCNRVESGFKTEVALEFETVGGFLPSGNNCYPPRGLMIPLHKITRANFTFGEQCGIQVEEAWCFRDEETGCALHVHQPDGSTTVTYLRMGNQPISYPPNRLVFDDQSTSALLQWYVLLNSVETLRNVLIAPEMALFTVERDAMIQKFFKIREETQINTLLFGLTLGPAVLVTVFTALVALNFWSRHVYIPVRTGYNRCNSAMDILKCAACVSYNDGEMGFPYEQDVFVGVSRILPHVGPIPEGCVVKGKDVDTGTVLPEEELE